VQSRLVSRPTNTEVSAIPSSNGFASAVVRYADCRCRSEEPQRSCSKGRMDNGRRCTSGVTH
jgi:hypothetical protein